jgi:hypothetical protein
MSGVVHRVDQDYWQPPRGSQAEDAAVQAHALACPECGTEFVVGSRFCHVCGAEREAMTNSGTRSFTEWLDFTRIREAIGLSAASLVCLIAGIVCIIAAIVTGFIYTANTVLDWQAVQIWRMEWLLAATVAFVAGILLKKYDLR